MRGSHGITDEGVIATILRDSLSGLNHLHENHYIHRDIKAGNILLNNRGQVKLGNSFISLQCQTAFSCLFLNKQHQGK